MIPPEMPQPVKQIMHVSLLKRYKKQQVRCLENIISKTFIVKLWFSNFGGTFPKN